MMERIKIAVEKARAERQEQQNGAKVPETKKISESSPLNNPEITYRKTKICSVNPVVLRENNVIYSEDDIEGLTAYKMLRTQVIQRLVARSWNALAISSPCPGDGKTLTAVNLAISLARELHHTVLLVDLDLRNPNVHQRFGIEPEFGIEDYLLHGTPMEQILINPDIERLVIMPCKSPASNSSELLSSPAMGRLVQELKSRYPSRMVLFDLPPVLSADDMLAFAPHIDACLLVLRDAKTTATELQHAFQILKDVPILGTVLNGSADKVSTYY